VLCLDPPDLEHSMLVLCKAHGWGDLICAVVRKAEGEDFACCAPTLFLSTTTRGVFKHRRQTRVSAQK